MTPLGTLYVVATPLGNLGDLSQRATELLRRVPVVVAEDTRHSRRLLSAIAAHPAELVSFHAHSDPGRIAALVERLQAGQDLALITDAGTPGVSDPGPLLVAAAHAAAVPVVPIPGPSAVATALMAAGLPADRYLFLGFLARKGPERRRQLAEVASSPWTVVLYEAPSRVATLLADLLVAVGPTRTAVIGRELTKLHEEFRVGPLSDLAAAWPAEAPRGEVTLVVAGRAERSDAAVDPDEVRRMIATRLAAGESRREVVRLITAEFGLARNEAYALVMDA